MSRHVTRMEIEDAEHYTPEQRAAIIASYPVHEREARTRGIPTLGSGSVFTVAEQELRIAPFTIPASWPQIVGVDFGVDHPFAACRMAWDRDHDTLYVTAVYRQKNANAILHAAAIKPWGDWIPVAWPHDGLQRDKGSGEQLAAQYRAQGLKMLPERATFEDGTHGFEAGISEMAMRMETGRWRVFASCEEWFSEYRMYHRKDGLVVKEDDDVLSAGRYAMMAKRFAVVKPSDRQWKPRTVPVA